MAIPTNIDLANEEKAGLNDDLPRRKKKNKRMIKENIEESSLTVFFPLCIFT